MCHGQGKAGRGSSWAFRRKTLSRSDQRELCYRLQMSYGLPFPLQSVLETQHRAGKTDSAMQILRNKQLIFKRLRKLCHR